MPRYKYDQFIKDLAGGAYAWPGGYPLYFITADGEALSFESAQANQGLILEAINTADISSGWQVIGCDVNWEDTQLICAHSNKKIQSAYGDDDKNLDPVNPNA